MLFVVVGSKCEFDHVYKDFNVGVLLNARNMSQYQLCLRSFVMVQVLYCGGTPLLFAINSCTCLCFWHEG